MKSDEFGDKLKALESVTTNFKIDQNLPVIVRLDGCAFHTFTKGLNRPFDINLSNLMVETTEYLCSVSNAKIGYTQSDEITLVLMTDSPESKMLFDGKLFKLTSVLASKCSAFFNKKLSRFLPSKDREIPAFDCRVFNVPDKKTVIDVLKWRMSDATRNSISMAAQANFSHKSLQGKSSRDMLEMLKEKGVEWSEYPEFFKYGTFIVKNKINIKFDLLDLFLKDSYFLSLTEKENKFSVDLKSYVNNVTLDLSSYIYSSQDDSSLFKFSLNDFKNREDAVKFIVFVNDIFYKWKSLDASIKARNTKEDFIRSFYSRNYTNDISNLNF